MRNPILYPAVILISSLLLAAAPAPMQIGEALGRRLLISHVFPGLTRDDAKNHLTGSGVFDIEFDYDSGLVRDVRIIQSTGHDSLDSKTIAGLTRWRAKKHTIHVLRVPITYMMNGGQV